MLKPTVHILLATYNGARFLAEQLDSLARQSHTQWTLTVSDDGSTDDTLAIVARFAQRVTQQVTVLQGPRQGSSTKNFFNLIQQVPADNSDDLFAFCDQDDVWLDNKLERAVQWHGQHATEPVRLYCGRTQFVNEHLNPIGLSPGIKRPPSFGNALVQNIASGNTMIMSQAVILAQKKVKPEHSVWHDWTTYLIVTALGGLVKFDEISTLLYRQHERNVIGSNDGLAAKIQRVGPLIEGRFHVWSDINIAAVHGLHDDACDHARQTCKNFEKMRSAPNALQRLSTFLRSPVRRQGLGSNGILALALIFKLA